jgi:hypothetical protein
MALQFGIEESKCRAVLNCIKRKARAVKPQPPQPGGPPDYYHAKFECGLSDYEMQLFMPMVVMTPDPKCTNVKAAAGINCGDNPECVKKLKCFLKWAGNPEAARCL